MKCQLIATVIAILTGRPARKNGDKRPTYPVTRTVVYYIKFWHRRFLRCGCSPHVDFIYDADAIDTPLFPACPHIQALYSPGPHRLTPEGHEMFDWRYAAHALKETR